MSGARFDLILDSAHFTGGLPSSDTAATAGNSSHSLLLLPGQDTSIFSTTTIMFAEVRLESSNLIAFKKTVGRERNEGYWTGEGNSIFC